MPVPGPRQRGRSQILGLDWPSGECGGEEARAGDGRPPAVLLFVAIHRAEAKEADLTDEQIYFMLGEIDGYDYLERTTGTAQRKLVEDLRRQYARIEPKYFSTAPKKTDDGLLGDITPPKID